MWTFGVLVLTGLSPRTGWRKLINPITITLVIAVALNLSGVGAHIPEPVMEVVRSLGRCAIPLGLIMIGVTMANYLDDVRALYEPRVTWGSSVLRLAILPLGILAAAKWFPGSLELKRVLVVEAAMPAAVFPIVLTRLHHGHPLTAVQVVPWHHRARRARDPALDPARPGVGGVVRPKVVLPNRFQPRIWSPVASLGNTDQTGWRISILRQFFATEAQSAQRADALGFDPKINHDAWALCALCLCGKIDLGGSSNQPRGFPRSGALTGPTPPG